MATALGISLGFGQFLLLQLALTDLERKSGRGVCVFTGSEDGQTVSPNFRSEFRTRSAVVSIFVAPTVSTSHSLGSSQPKP